MKKSLGISSRLVQIVKVTVFISSIFFKKNPALNALTGCADHILRGLCVINGFSFIYNDMKTTKISLERWYPSTRSKHEFFKQEFYRISPSTRFK